jgi:hypothetical protein
MLKELIAAKRTPNVEIFVLLYQFPRTISIEALLCKNTTTEEIETLMLGYL